MSEKDERFNRAIAEVRAFREARDAEQHKEEKTVYYLPIIQRMGYHAITGHEAYKSFDVAKKQAQDLAAPWGWRTADVAAFTLADEPKED